ncbi:MAG: hypothetical protein LBQ42_14060 [Synergistaceae bacterium]|jgi:hypothetical protein|nr:hypothetical protein [Synergistaceae bacterium]
MTTTTIEREKLFEAIKTLPDDKVNFALSLINELQYEGDEPNEETAKALRESADMRNLIGPFHNMEDFMASLLSDDNA